MFRYKQDRLSNRMRWYRTQVYRFGNTTRGDYDLSKVDEDLTTRILHERVEREQAQELIRRDFEWSMQEAFWRIKSSACINSNSNKNMLKR